MRRIVTTSVLLVALFGLVACGDTDESVSIGEREGTTDDSTPTDEPEVFEPPEEDGADGDGGEADGDAEVARLLAATEEANSGSFELVDELGGNGSAAGDFQQDPVAFLVDYSADPTLPGRFLVVDDTAYVQEGGQEEWTDAGPAELSEDVILDIGPLPARILEALLATGQPEVLDAETGGAIYRWTTTGEEVGSSSGYADAEATVDVQADDEGRLHTLTVTQGAVDESLAGGTFELTFEYAGDAPPITAPPDPAPFPE